ncbi:VPS35 endosomal protein-sorting factor-like isoform X2 [Ricinus communis]|uniref:VPS35 endosomal protein-sorting factor-like isoform X2 n=1 Tax=Ricinus communis TaxID=3988 RepID=UPI00201B035F|nr:VPS35 endosomal protein-sorting factor-like isoform X2 [Ricinus communis]
MEFRSRDYSTEQKVHALPRSRADHHPLSTLSPSPHNQIVVVVANREDNKNNDFFDPLRGGGDVNAAISNENTPDNVDNVTFVVNLSSEASTRTSSKEWNSFKRFLMQKFPVSKMISVSYMPDVIIKSGKELDKSSKSTHIEELNDSQKEHEEDAKVITRQEYVSRLNELKDEIMRAWHGEDRVTALKLSIKVAKLLMDTSVLQFYPTLFVLATDVMDMLGDMVWKRIRQKAELSESGTFLRTLPEIFKASDICSDAKDTCNNWFCKVGSIRELLPRIYLELAIFPCWRFLLDHPEDNLQRLVMMTRGLADPLASAYCRLYMAHCARKLPGSDKGYLITCVNDIKILLGDLLSTKGPPDKQFAGKIRLLVSLIEPAIEYIMKCIFENASQSQVHSVLVEIGLGRNFPCVSIVLHNLLKELPTEVISSNAVDILHLIKGSNDYSFDQYLNFRLLGFRLAESRSQMDIINSVMDEVIQDNYLNILLEGLYTRACSKEAVEDEQGCLQSIMLKLLSHLKDLNNVLSLKHFLDILDVMYGSSRSFIDMHILNMATRYGQIHDPSTIQLLFEISQSLHDGIDFASMKDDDNQQPAHLICRFVQMVDYGAEMEQHLTFLVECRGAFGSVNELKETLVHSSNYLATKALKDGKKHLTLVKSCLAFSEVTIPSIAAQVRQLNLYLETAEVALLGGLISHSDGLIISAISCLENVDFAGGSQTPTDVDGILSSIRKLCSLLVMVPGVRMREYIRKSGKEKRKKNFASYKTISSGNSDQGVTNIPSSIVSLICSRSWMTPRMKTKFFCAIILLLATLSQNKLPYHVCNSEILGNDLLYFGDSSYVHELVSMSESVLWNLVKFIELEPSKAARGSLALEACNCIALSFKVSEDILQVCWKLIETAELCLSTNDRFLQSTIKYLDEHLPNFRAMPSVAV